MSNFSDSNVRYEIEDSRVVWVSVSNRWRERGGLAALARELVDSYPQFDDDRPRLREVAALGSLEELSIYEYRRLSPLYARYNRERLKYFEALAELPPTVAVRTTRSGLAADWFGRTLRSVTIDPAWAHGKSTQQFSDALSELLSKPPEMPTVPPPASLNQATDELEKFFGNAGPK